jgi:Acyl-CoA reductase (LuxC)
MSDLHKPPIDLLDWKRFLAKPKIRLTPFQPILMSFCTALSKTLFDHPRIKQFPDLMALAFWLRPSHLEELSGRFQALTDANQLLVPRGLAFHIAPANVETLFAYSWILSLLVGNSNVIRVPSKEAESLELLFSEIGTLLGQPEYLPIQESTRLISYGHEEEITALFSAHADVRLIWGGDKTIDSIRKIPLKTSAKEIVFGDRFAYACIQAERYQEISEKEKQRLALEFYNDVFWYDQMACSSPRLIFWIGSPEKSKEASEYFYQLLQKVIEEKHYALPLGSILQNQVSLYDQALSQSAIAIKKYGEVLTVLEIERFGLHAQLQQGTGLLFHLVLGDLKEIAQFISSEDQTLVYEGFTKEELFQLVKELNGRGLDRLVPIGRALHFDYLWDGYHLLMELTRMVQIE